MGARVIKSRSLAAAIARRRDSRTLAGLLLAAIGPLSLVYLLTAADLRQDLSDAKPKPNAVLSGYSIIGWNALAVEDRADRNTILHRGPLEHSDVAVLGYMMDGSQAIPELTRVSAFILMPDAGSWIHPAHRESDEMIEVTLTPGTRVIYTDRRLVWVTGRFRHIRFELRYGTALYSLDDATIRDASEKDFAEWFLP